MKSPRMIEIVVSVKFFKREGKLYQHFDFSNQKYSKYLKDPRYFIKQQFNEKIIEHSLGRDPDCEYIEKRDGEDEIILVYESKKEKVPDAYYFKIVDYVPPNPGCAFCIYRGEKDGKIICKFQNNKVLEKEIINCRLFRQKRIFKT